jgi:ribosomal subunit interface protein
MHYMFHIANVSEPTVESFQDYTRKRLNNLSKFFRGETKVNISLYKIGRNEFQVKIEIINRGKIFYASTTEYSLTEAVDKITKQLKRQIKV